MYSICLFYCISPAGSLSGRLHVTVCLPCPLFNDCCLIKWLRYHQRICKQSDIKNNPHIFVNWTSKPSPLQTALVWQSCCYFGVPPYACDSNNEQRKRNDKRVCVFWDLHDCCNQASTRRRKHQEQTDKTMLHDTWQNGPSLSIKTSFSHSIPSIHLQSTTKTSSSNPCQLRTMSWYYILMTDLTVSAISTDRHVCKLC